MAENRTHYRYVLFLTEPCQSLILSGPPIADPSHLTIRLTFSGVRRYPFFHNHDSPDRLLTHTFPSFHHYFHLIDLLSSEGARDAVRGLLRARWPSIPSLPRHGLADSFLQETRDAILRLRAQDGLANDQLEAEFHVVVDYGVTARPSYDEVIARSMREEARMVPADEKSIRAVMGGKRAWGDDEENDNEAGPASCVICMEEFGKGCQVARLPCRHDFHGECIERWLRTSHYCPVCRYEMPTC